jgi:hypothetical protein
MLLPVNTSRRLLIAAQLLLAIAYTLPVFSSDLLWDSDFLSFYTGSAIMREGHGARIYDLDLQSAYQAQELRLEGVTASSRLLPFINPPHTGAMLMPLAYLRPKPAAFVFLAFNCLLAVWVLRRFWQLAAGWTQPARLLLITTILGTEVFWYGLATRTLTLIVLACLIEYYLALRDGRDGRAATWLIAATIKPQLILLPAVIPLARGRWRLIGMVGGLGLLIALSISLLLGFHIWLDYFRLLHEVSAYGQSYGASPLLMNNLRAILYRVIPSAAVDLLVYLALLGSAAGIFWLWRSAHDFGLSFALTVLLGLFVAPHLNYQDTLIAFLPAAISYDFAQRTKSTLLPCFQVFLAVATFLPPLLIFTESRTLRWIWPLLLILILLVVCGLALRQEGVESTRLPPFRKAS